ncbi:hypothetical protein DRO37_09675 [Candidatus Bathyarchaeota archaeon]|nr:MAG: hypothetical protein DRO37_09675 [Candidatus Bathyarchaeota archaeon]
MGVFKQRKLRLKIRKIKDTIKYANEDCHKDILKLNNSQKLCACPECKSNENVRYTGTNKGMNKFVCNNPKHERSVWFSTSTSYEAMEIYREKLAQNLCLLTCTNSVVKGIRLYNETSKYFVEFALEALYEFINEEVNQSVIRIDKKADIVTVFLDLSGSGLAKNKAIILARVGDKTIFEIVTVSNYLSSHKIIAAVKKKLKISRKTKLVFITDGEKCFVDSIKHFFPDALHIRQFHSKSCKGIIYIHLKYMKNEYTIRCLWDSVLNDGKASKAVVKMRELKAKKRLNDKEHKKNIKYSDLSKDVIVWEGTVYLPRGVRRVLTPNKRNKKNLTIKQKLNTYTTDTAPIIFKGTLEEAKKLKVVVYCFGILKKIFGGLYITSNVVETIFNFKTKFSPHRTIKFGQRLLVCVIYNCLILKGKTKKELIKFFKERVITYEFIMQKVLYGSGLQKNKHEPPSFIEIIKEAIFKNKKLILHYCDRTHKHTSRIITPQKIVVNDYNNTTQIESFCHLRKEKRTFYLERVRDIRIYDQEAICL